jgi:OprF membrane domain
MSKRLIAMAGLLILAGTTSTFAQHRVEASAMFGWSFNDGVSSTQTIIAMNGNAYNRIDPKDTGLWGLGIGLMLSEQTEAGFMWNHQGSKLVAGGALGTPDREIGNMSINNYHGYLSYNFGESGTKIRPFVYGGLGATSFGNVDFGMGTIGGNTQFSTTWGTGVKYFVSPKIGIRAGASWTPVYIKSDASGYWCDPYWGCYLVGDAQYSNQFHLTGGVTFRF